METCPNCGGSGVDETEIRTLNIRHAWDGEGYSTAEKVTVFFVCRVCDGTGEVKSGDHRKKCIYVSRQFRDV